MSKQLKYSAPAQRALVLDALSIGAVLVRKALQHKLINTLPPLFRRRLDDMLKIQKKKLNKKIQTETFRFVKMMRAARRTM